MKWISYFLLVLMFAVTANAALTYSIVNGNLIINETGISSQNLSYGQHTIFGLNSLTITNITANNLISNVHSDNAIIIAPANNFQQINLHSSCVNGQNSIVNNAFNLSVSCPPSVSATNILEPSSMMQKFIYNPIHNVSFIVVVNGIQQNNKLILLGVNQTAKDNLTNTTYKGALWNFTDRINSSITKNQTITTNGLNITILRAVLKGHYVVSPGYNFTIPNTSITVYSQSDKANVYEKLSWGGEYKNNQTNTTILAPTINEIVGNESNEAVLFDSLSNIGCAPGGNVTFWDYNVSSPVTVCEHYNNHTLDDPFLLDFSSAAATNSPILGLGQEWAYSYTISNSNSSYWKGQANNWENSYNGVYDANLANITSNKNGQQYVSQAYGIVYIGLGALVIIIAVIFLIVYLRNNPIQYRGGKTKIEK